MKKIVFYLVNLLFTFYLSAQQLPLSVVFEHPNLLNKSNIYISNDDTIFYNLQNGVIDGDFIYLGKNKTNISGEYKHSHPNGKWNFIAKDTKLKIKFVNPGIIKFNTVKNSTNNVFAGFGKINISYPSINADFSDTLISTLPIRWGKINGEVKELYKDSTLRAIYNYKNGRYDGKQTYYLDNGNRWEIIYKKGKPVSNKTFYNARGDEYRKIKLAEIDKKNDFITYFDPVDVIYNVKMILNLDSNFSQYPLLNDNVIDSINQLYYYRKIITYKDYNLQQEDWGAHDRPNIWDVTTDTLISKGNIIGIALVGRMIIMHQDFQYRLQPLAASYVVSYDYNDQKHFKTSPWFYIPELMQRNLIFPYGSILYYPFKISDLPIGNTLDAVTINEHSQVLIPLEYIKFLKELFLVE